MKQSTSEKDNLKIKPFSSAEKWEQWLSKNHSKSKGVWIKFHKKGSGAKTVTYTEALDEALCYGWIDGLANSYDDKSYLQKFTPRRAKSIWSKRNREHIERLIKAGKMKEAGLKEINAAKSDGRWERAYDSPANMRIPDDFLKELSKNKKAKAFFDSLNKTNLYSIGWRLQTAKTPETRNKWKEKILKMMSDGKKFH
ncbi:MAG: YdeI/OmpD-associated family protein [Ignavibacteria bacterium]|nr:YdeI/OmpD-associated family protein [Ignavibacteria bacterium]